MPEKHVAGARPDPQRLYWDIVRAGVSRILQQKDKPFDQVLAPDTALLALNLDSLDLAELLIEFELSLAVEIGMPDMQGVTTLGDLVRLIQRLHAPADA